MLVIITTDCIYNTMLYYINIIIAAMLYYAMYMYYIVNIEKLDCSRKNKAALRKITL